MRRYLLLVALLLVVVPLTVVVSEEVPNDHPAFCLLLNGVSWLPVDSLPHALRQCVIDETPTQVMNGVTFVPIKRFVEAQGGTVAWDASAGLVIVEFDDQRIPFKALYPDSFWASPNVKALEGRTLPQAQPGAAKTREGKEWEPPRLVDGVWVTSGVSDEVARQYATTCNEGKTRDEVRQSEWDVYWQWHWDEERAPEWALARGQQTRNEARREWQRYYANQQQGGLTGLEQYGQFGLGLGQYEQGYNLSTGLFGSSQTFSTPLSLGYRPGGRPLGYSSGGSSSGYSSGGSSSLCGSPTKTTGAPCRRKVRGGGYCWQHR